MYIYIINTVCCVGRVSVEILYKSKYSCKKVGVQPIRIVLFSLTFRASVLRQRETAAGPMLEMLDYTIHIGSTPTFLYMYIYIYSVVKLWDLIKKIEELLKQFLWRSAMR